MYLTYYLYVSDGNSCFLVVLQSFLSHRDPKNTFYEFAQIHLHVPEVRGRKVALVS